MSWQEQGEPWAERVAWLVEKYAAGSQAQFAERIEASRETIRVWGQKKRHPSMENLASILTKWPRVNPDWLVTGRGPRERELSDDASEVAHDVMARLLQAYHDLEQRYGPSERPGADPAKGRGRKAPRRKPSEEKRGAK